MAKLANWLLTRGATRVGEPLGHWCWEAGIIVLRFRVWWEYDRPRFG